MNAHRCALADEVVLSIDGSVQQDSRGDIPIATIGLLSSSVSAAGTGLSIVESV
ncbi:MAG: hypothetical protein KTR15_07920 [Phycisphaeraceae bacterium]|nr:hypothetical protein [Phycisphaeraceae bacterium]